MKTVLKEFSVTEDRNEFTHEIDAVQHERRVQALGKVKALLLKAPAVKIGAREGIGEECVEEFIGDLGAWMLYVGANTPDASKLLTCRLLAQNLTQQY